jgi:hypothetical protein
MVDQVTVRSDGTGAAADWHVDHVVVRRCRLTLSNPG